jgi:hypothetical protein
MTATTLTPATAGAELLDRLRALVDRHDAVATLEEVRALADEVTAVLRSTRGRIGRLARQAAAATKPPGPARQAETEPVRPTTAPTPASPAAVADIAATPRTPAPGIAGRAVAAAASAVRLVRRAVGAVARHARALLTRRRGDLEAPAVEVHVSEREAVDEREVAVRQPSRVEEDLAAIPDLNAEQAAGLACIECGIDFWTTGTLRVPIGVAESSGEAVFACVGACARQAGHREPVGEQLALGEAS